ncbi:MAG: O-methyltransferase [Rickettsiales bacterium]|nr:O-methyltransferase [Rickettsiales bacterium]
MSLRNTHNLDRNNYIYNLYKNEESQALQAVKQSIFDNNLRSINLNFNEAKILKFLIKLNKIERIVEFGTLAGYSAISMAEVISDKGKIFTFEIDEKVAEIAKQNIKNANLQNKISIIIGDAHKNLAEKNLLEDFYSKPIDMVFIDAEKQGYPEYLEWAYQNVRSGGLIIADNTFLFNAVFDAEEAKKQNPKILNAMLEFNKNFADKEKFESVILPTDDGLSIAIKK